MGSRMYPSFAMHVAFLIITSNKVFELSGANSKRFWKWKGGRVPSLMKQVVGYLIDVVQHLSILNLLRKSRKLISEFSQVVFSFPKKQMLFHEDLKVKHLTSFPGLMVMRDADPVISQRWRSSKAERELQPRFEDMRELKQRFPSASSHSMGEIMNVHYPTMQNFAR